MKPRRIEYADGSSAEIDLHGRWDLCLPNGEIVRGIATDTSQAREHIEQTHNDWALERWNKGIPSGGRLFVCVLS